MRKEKNSLETFTHQIKINWRIDFSNEIFAGTVATVVRRESPEGEKPSPESRFNRSIIVGGVTCVTCSGR